MLTKYCLWFLELGLFRTLKGLQIKVGHHTQIAPGPDLHASQAWVEVLAKTAPGVVAVVRVRFDQLLRLIGRDAVESPP